MVKLTFNQITAIATLMLILVLINWKIADKEDHISNGQVVYLALAPVDPRSLMQGDYMALRFALANELRANLVSSADLQTRGSLNASDGYIEVALDDKRVASLNAVSPELPPTAGNAKQADRVWLHYRVRAGRIKLATNAFFFQEGHAKTYEAARFGQFRVNEKGELLLTAMVDDRFNILGPSI